MSDSNANSSSGQEATVQVQKPKTYTERFTEMEDVVGRLIYVSNFHTKTLAEMVQRMDAVSQTLENIRNTVNAMIHLSEAKQPITFDGIVSKILQLQTEASKKSLQEDLAKGLIVATDVVKDDNTIVAFSSSPDIEYGLSAIASFPEEIRKQLVGKKVGDLVNNVTILEIYEQNLTSTQETQTNEQNQQATN